MLLFPVATLALVGSAYADTSYYLSVPTLFTTNNANANTGISGVPTTSIQIFSFDVGWDTTTSVSSGGTAIGKTVFGSVTATHNVGYYTPSILKAISQGTLLKTAQVLSVNDNGDGSPTLNRVYNFTDIAFNSQQLANDQETFTFVFQAVSISTQAYSASGTVSNTNTFGWNQVTQKATYF